MSHRFFLAGLLMLMAAGAPALADEWPSRPVRILSTFAAGGAADVLARVIAENLSTALKQQFFVEVRAGAGGQLAVRTILDSPPDGYNFVLVSVSHLVIHPMSRADATYDPLGDHLNIAFAADRRWCSPSIPKRAVRRSRICSSAARTSR
jgi:tripartite-type tricarboxylate transporter receptor subunit TctC